MQELEKILEEIGELRGQAGSECTSEDHYIKKAWEHCLDRVVDIIRKHMNDSKCGNCSRRKWYQIGFKDELKSNDDWISVEERMPEDGQTVLCTDGEYVYLVEYDADLDAPFGDMDSITHWQPSPEPYRPEQPETCKYTGGSCCWPIDQCKECPNYPERSEEE